MANTVTIEANEVWQNFISNVGVSFAFSVGGPGQVYVLESALAPDADETGYLYWPGKRSGGKVESSPFWVRTKEGTSLFHFG